MKRLIALYNILEGKWGNTQATLSKQEINDFRKYCLDQGFRKDYFENLGLDWQFVKNEMEGFVNPLETSQEDALELYLFLAEALEMPKIPYKVKATYTFPFALTYLDRRQKETEYTILIKTPEEERVFTIQELVQNNTTQETIDVNSILNAENNPLSVEQKQELEKHKNTSIPITHEVQLFKEELPSFITIVINRYGADTRQDSLKKQAVVTPSDTITLGTVDDPTHTVSFKLAAIVVHAGISYNGGHYRTYVPKLIDGKEVWLEFDDDIVSRHDAPKTQKIGYLQQTPHEDAEHNGYLYFYVRQ